MPSRQVGNLGQRRSRRDRPDQYGIGRGGADVDHLCGEVGRVRRKLLNLDDLDIGVLADLGQQLGDPLTKARGIADDGDVLVAVGLHVTDEPLKDHAVAWKGRCPIREVVRAEEWASAG
jgi:hypothetical protein